MSALKLQHNKECKGLLVQIRYLKAKFTREALFRDHLGYQKQYLLEILSQFERGWGSCHSLLPEFTFSSSDRRILVAIARIGYPIAPCLKKLNRFRAVGIMIIFLSRVRYVLHLLVRTSSIKSDPLSDERVLLGESTAP